MHQRRRRCHPSLRRCRRLHSCRYRPSLVKLLLRTRIACNGAGQLAPRYTIGDADPRRLDQTREQVPSRSETKATEREFELRRTSIVQRGQENPIERVAAFLIALSRNNAMEGRDPSVIGDVDRNVGSPLTIWA